MTNLVTDRSLGTDLKETGNKIRDGWKSIFGESKDFNKLAYHVNPHSMLNELLTLFWFALICGTAVTMYYSFKYHLSIFDTAKNHSFESLAITSTLLVLGEGLKVFLGHRLMRSLFNGMFMKGVPEFMLIVVMSVICYYTFMWSVDISTKGYAIATSNKAKQDSLRKTGNYTAETQKIDEQIATVNQSIRNANATRWHGTITAEAQDNIFRSTKTLEKLNASRDKAIIAVQSKDSTFLELSGKEINQTEIRLSDYGGKAEWVVALAIFCICLCERIHYRQNKKEIDIVVKGKFVQFSPNNTPATQNANVVFSATNPIGFKNYSKDVAQNNDVAHVAHVPQSKTSVAHTVDPKHRSELDDKLELERGKILKRSRSQFQQAGRNNQTIADDIFKSCDNILLALEKGGDLNISSLTRFSDVAKTGLLLAEEFNFNYPNANKFAEIMTKVIKKLEIA